MRHINALLNSPQYSSLMTLLNEGRDRSKIGTSELSEEQIDELEEVLL